MPVFAMEATPTKVILAAAVGAILPTPAVVPCPVSSTLMPSSTLIEPRLTVVLWESGVTFAAAVVVRLPTAAVSAPTVEVVTLPRQ